MALMFLSMVVADKRAKVAKMNESITDMYLFLYGRMFAIKRLHTLASAVTRKAVTSFNESTMYPKSKTKKYNDAKLLMSLPPSRPSR